MIRSERAEISKDKERAFRAWSWIFWLLAFSPALLQLSNIMLRRLPLPYQDSWAFLDQYQHWCEGRYSWSEFFAPHNVHPSAPGKLVYFAVLQFARGDVSLLPLLSWTLSVVISLGVLALSRSLWRGKAVQGACLMFLANLSIFTSAQSIAWIWDFVFQNFFPGTCLVLGFVVLSGAQTSWRRWVCAVLLALFSSFSFGSGFAVGFLLWPAVALALKRRSITSRVMLNSAWILFCLASGWVALNAFGPGERTGLSVDGVLLKPLENFNYVLAMLGHTLGRGTAVELVPICAAWGVLLLIIFIGCTTMLLARRDLALFRRSWPWIAFCLWSILNAAMICIGRFHANPETGLADHYGTFMLFLPLGVLMLVTTVTNNEGGGCVADWMRKMVPAAVATLIIGHALSWNDGVRRMELFHRKLASRMAALDFTNVLPTTTSVFYHLRYGDKAASLTRFIMERGRLRDVTFARDAMVSSFSQGSSMASKRGDLRVVTGIDGADELQGIYGLTVDPLATPDLVVISASATGVAERIIALLPPELPDDFFDRVARRRKYYEHYFGWQWPIDHELLPKEDVVTLRAYAYDRSKRRIRELQRGVTLAPRKQE